ncbi:MAG: NAD(P)(+) transhydrogenase (Re/Si-specific) subunit beta [SAR202 cluster bacterium]|nr:NAD(P)(+) transhydrogenase (Re/Si-specific) subunit beta [SAR202 cluster bacterium]
MTFDLDLTTKFIYILAAILIILGLKGLSSPKTAIRGNIIASIGMLIAVIVTLVANNTVSIGWIFGGIIVGSLIGIILATRTTITSMPQLVATFNGLGGAASVLVATNEFINRDAGSVLDILDSPADMPIEFMLFATLASALIGSITFWGSMIAFSKLQGLLPDNPILIPGRHIFNVFLLILIVVSGFIVMAQPINEINPNFYWVILIASAILGISLVISIGGADMPVVISLLNSYSGLAAAATGLLLGNILLVIGGSLVGAAGIILTSLMCKAMNRSLTNVFFGGIGSTSTTEDKNQDDIYEGKVKATSADEIALLLDNADKVMILPGYGMAVAQAQHSIHDLSESLKSKGIEVKFAIHPVAGRMPGHMNVLLAEADVPYDDLIEMDEANPLFKETDVAIVVGANDVVNPLAYKSDDPGNPIAGMPILQADQAKTIIVIKRSLSPGFANIANPLFAADNTLMLFEDAKKASMDLLTSFKNL